MRTHTRAHVDIHATRYTRSIREMLSRAAAGGQGGQAAGPKWGQSVHAFMLLPRIRLHCVCVCYCVLYVFSLFYFCWRQRKQLRLFAGASLSPPHPLSLSVWACPAADESTFAFTQVTKYKRNETERKSQTKRAQVKQKPQWRHGRREGRGQRAQPAKIRHNSTHRWAA